MQATQIVKAFGAATVLDGASFRVDRGQRLAVVGRNGAGKTTLLRILAGELEPDGGSVTLAPGETLALHDQRPPLGRDVTLAAYVAEGLDGARRAEARLAELERRMSDGDAGPDVLRSYERAQAALEGAGGYAWRSWLERVMRGLGIPAAWGSRPLGSFSGGELTRAALARTLVSRPDLLLLDEPTNHLDIASVEWLERTLVEMDVAAIVVSHDRWFLESVATGVLEIEGGRTRLWPMGYSSFRRERALAEDRQGRLAERRAAEIARLERFVERWRAGTRARQAASRRKRLDRLEPMAPPTRRRALEFGFPRVEQSSRVVIEADGLSVGAGERTLVTGAGFVVERGQRVAVMGPNGAGKTTLVETLIGRRAPLAGRVGIGHKVHPAYFSQHGVELRDDQTVLESVAAGSTLTQGQARTLLGNFLFGEEMVDRRVDRLSGGERARLSLVGLIARGGNLLVLDEPTNHMDAESREALEDALQAYDGTIMIVTHDRALIDSVATHTLSLEEGRAVLRHGNYTDLIAGGEASAAPPQPRPAPQRAPRRAPSDRASRRPSRRVEREVAQLEGRIEELERAIAEVERDLGDPAVMGDHLRLAARGEDHRRLQRELAWRMREWEQRAQAL